MPYNQTPHSPAKQNPIKKLVDKVLGRGGEVTGGRSSKKAIKSMKKSGLTGDPYADEKILFNKSRPPLNQEQLTLDQEKGVTKMLPHGEGAPGKPTTILYPNPPKGKTKKKKTRHIPTKF